VLHGSVLYVGNTLSGSTNCGDSADLTGGGGAVTWPADTARNISVTVDATGKVSVTIDGAAPVPGPDKPDERLRAMLLLGDSVSEDAFMANCRPPSFPAETVLYFGASGNPEYDDTFFGTVSNLAIKFAAYDAV
jgi:hypothetical protein